MVPSPLLYFQPQGEWHLPPPLLSRDLPHSSPNNLYNKTISWIRCSLSFSLVRSALSWLRGARSSFHHPFRSDANIPLDVAISEGRVLLSHSLNTELLFITPTVVYVYLVLFCIGLYCIVLYCIVLSKLWGGGLA